jgi:hypothetical protein
VHITIPTDNPWVPLRILGLGKQPEAFVRADIFLLTDIQPLWLPHAGDGLTLAYYGEATESLLNDLRSDAGMGWVPESAWLTKLQLGDTVRRLKYDLAVDASGEGMPSYRAAGLIPLPNAGGGDGPGTASDWFLIAVPAVVLVGLAAKRYWRRRTWQ